MFDDLLNRSSTTRIPSVTLKRARDLKSRERGERKRGGEAEEEDLEEEDRNPPWDAPSSTCSPSRSCFLFLKESMDGMAGEGAGLLASLLTKCRWLSLRCAPGS